MTQPRLIGLVGLMGALVIVRVLAPPGAGDRQATVVAAMVRRPILIAPTATDVPAAAPSSSLSAFTDDGPDGPGNAFAVRLPAAPPDQPQPPATLPAQKNVVIAPVVASVVSEPPPTPLPFGVIGTWDDSKEPGVFLSSPYGTLLARVGATLQAEYRVTAITPQQITLLHLESKRESQLAIPRPPETSFTLAPSFH